MALIESLLSARLFLTPQRVGQRLFFYQRSQRSPQFIRNELRRQCA